MVSKIAGGANVWGANVEPRLQRYSSYKQKHLMQKTHLFIIRPVIESGIASASDGRVGEGGRNIHFCIRRSLIKNAYRKYGSSASAADGFKKYTVRGC